MKITNSKTGKTYQLTPETQLEVECPNLFFNEWGEQTLPVNLPDSPWNQEALGFPDITSLRKLPTDIDATISSGEYFSVCRQAILKVKRKEIISTSFYLNEGSFLSRLSNTSLQKVFENEVIPGVNTIQQGLDFCKSLITNQNSQFAIFPVLIDFDNGQRYINRVEFMNGSGELVSMKNGTLNFFNMFPRVEEVDGVKVKLDAGYYMTPFVRAAYLLRRVFAYFGYTLLENFFDVTEPFKSMVFLNNTMDSLVNGTILLSHLVPDCKCNTLLNVFRKKFLCEFIPDEVRKTVTIDFFDDVAKAKAKIDLTGSLVSTLEFDVPSYQRVCLSSETMMNDGDTYDSTYDMKIKYPNACVKLSTGDYYRVGYLESQTTYQRISSANIPYSAGGDLKEKKITCPDALFYLKREKRPEDTDRSNGWRTQISFPFIGDGRSLNSTLVLKVADENNTEPSEDPTNNKEQPPMLALIYQSPEGYAVGTNTNYTHNDLKFADYSLLNNGPDGIYEKFYRTYDDLLRNSMHPVQGDILLTDHQKMNIPSHRKVIIDGQELFIDKLKYFIGGENEPMKSSFYTTRLYEPVQVAMLESARFPLLNDSYCWSVQRDSYDISEAEYNAEINQIGLIGRGKEVLPAIYPPFPTKQQIESGGYYYERSYAYYMDGRDGRRHFYRVVSKLRPVKTPF